MCESLKDTVQTQHGFHDDSLGQVTVQISVAGKWICVMLYVICYMLKVMLTCMTTHLPLLQISTKSGRNDRQQGILQALIHACSTPTRFIDTSNIIF